MIIHKLIAHHLGHRDDADFYTLQANDAIRWLEHNGVVFEGGTKALDLGCGHGVFGLQLIKRGCSVTFSDDQNTLLPEIPSESYTPFRIGTDDVERLGQYDVVLFSNVLEHLAQPTRFLSEAHTLLRPNGFFFLSWTNWLSPWGGHEFSPFHYFGAKRGHRLYDWVRGKQRIHTPFVNLFPTYIGEMLRYIRALPGLAIVATAPRYYPEFAFMTRVPVLREFLTWNCAVLIQRK